MFRRSDGSLDMKTIFAFIVLAVCIISCIKELVIRPIDKASDIRYVEGTVTEKATKRVGRYEEKYLVFIDDGSGTVVPLEVTDSLMYGRFDSADVWGNIHEGVKYRFEVGGSRSEVSSWYPNIYSFEEIE